VLRECGDNVLQGVVYVCIEIHRDLHARMTHEGMQHRRIPASIDY